VTGWQDERMVGCGLGIGMPEMMGMTGGTNELDVYGDHTRRTAVADPLPRSVLSTLCPIYIKSAPISLPFKPRSSVINRIKWIILCI